MLSKKEKEDKKPRDKDRDKKGTIRPRDAPPTPTPPIPIPVTPPVQESEEERLRREEEARRRDEEKRKEEERKAAEAEKKRKEEEERRRREEEQRKREEEQRRREEEARQKLLEEQRRKKQWQEEDDWDSLDTLRPDPDMKYSRLPDRVFEAFHTISGHTRDLNTERAWQPPEVVLVGNQGEGKTSVLEILLGHTICIEPTLRPLHINMVNNMECEDPKIIFKRDGYLEDDFPSDKVVKVEDFAEEVALRNLFTEIPIQVRYEHKYCWNWTIIDTPGLLAPEEKKAADRESIVLEIIKPQDRFLIFIEDAKDWEKTQLVQLADKVDSKLRRSMFVYTKFNYVLQNFTTLRDLNIYLSARPSPKVKTFFVSHFSPSTRKQCITTKTFITKIEQALKRDLLILERLKYDHKHEQLIGSLAMRKHVFEIALKKYQDSIPDLLKQVRQLKKARSDNLHFIQQQIRTLDNNKLRSLASNYASDYLQYLVALLQGSLEGNPAINGQTLEEEKAITGEWADAENLAIQVSSKEWNIPNFDTKLYGGQQFERLLAEFKIVVDHLPLSNLSGDDIANASGLSGLKSVPNHIWAASDVAQKYCYALFVPLLKQLFHRAIFITKRLTDIVENIMESKRKRSGYHGQQTTPLVEPVSQLSIPKDFPRFTMFVRELFDDVIETTASSCLDKCMDELYCTRLIYWEHTSKNIIDAIAKNSRKNDDLKVAKKSVESLAKEIFQDQIKRITKNIVLKCYDSFLVKMAKSVSSEIQGQVASMSEEFMTEMFDISSTTEKLQEIETRMLRLAAVDNEASFMEAAQKLRI